MSVDGLGKTALLSGFSSIYGLHLVLFSFKCGRDYLFLMSTIEFIRIGMCS